MEAEVTKKLFTIDEYYRMGEAGILGEKARLELIEGEIIELTPVGNRHIACVNRVSALFASRLAGKAMFSVQNPILLSQNSEPQPDIVLARPREDYYADRRVSPAETFLVLEVSDSTFRYDSDGKLPLYFKWGVPEVWLVNLQNDVILVYREPGGENYKTALSLRRGEFVSLAAFPEVVFQVEELLG